jgi:hypothetical protein
VDALAKVEGAALVESAEPRRAEGDRSSLTPNLQGYWEGPRTNQITRSQYALFLEERLTHGTLNHAVLRR